MRSLVLVFVLAFMLSSHVHAAPNSTQLLHAAEEQLPTCAFLCLERTSAQAAKNDDVRSTCNTDFACQIHSEFFVKHMETCVRSTCTIRQTLITKKFTESLDHKPIRDHTHLVSYIGAGGGVLALIAVLLRIAARIPYLGGTWGQDDWAIVITMFFAVPLAALSVPLANHGLGKDIWEVPFDNITAILYIYYYDETLYLASIAGTKISILLFYLRIFPDRWFRLCVYGMLGACAIYILGFIPAIILQCIPIRVAWLHWDGEHHGKCINLNVEGWASGACNIAYDVIIIGLPLPILAKLKMKRRKKMGIVLMLLGGSFVTIVSCLRLGWMVQFANSQNLTWDYTAVGYWSTIEVHAGIVFACLPALRALQTRFFIKPRSPKSSLPSALSSKTIGGSPFASSTKRGKQRKMEESDFSQMDEEYQLETTLSQSKPGDTGRSSTNTETRHGSLHTEDDVELLPTQKTPGSLLPMYHKSDGLREKV